MSTNVSEVSLPTYLLMSKIHSIAYLIVAFVGWIGNGLMIAVTIRSKNLRAPSNILIAIQSASDIISTSYLAVFPYFVFSELFISSKVCFFFTMVPISAVEFSNWIVLFIAFDRFILTKFPLFHFKLDKKQYVIGIVWFCLTYTVILKVLAYVFMEETSTTCFATGGLTGVINYVWFSCTGIVTVGVVVLYKAILTHSSSYSEEYRKISRAVKTILLFHVFGWCFTVMSSALAIIFVSSPLTFSLVELTSGHFANLNMTATFFIYYNRSSVYKKAINHMMGRIMTAPVSSVS